MSGLHRRERRRDAQLNHDRIVRSARAAFAEHGLEVSMAEIARRAGVGIATLFRNFPTKEDLVVAVFMGPISSCAQSIDEALASNEDAGQTMTTLLTGICRLQAADKGFAAVIVSALETDSGFATARESMKRGLSRLLAEAARQGAIRTNLGLDDVALLLTANAGLLSITRHDGPTQSARLVAAMLQSFRP